MKTGTYNGNNFTNSPIIIGNDNNIVNVVNPGNNELDNIVKGIMDNLSDLKQEDAESIKDAVDMAIEELKKPDPKTSRLRSCVTLLAPMFTIANGIPTLANPLQHLVASLPLYLKN